VVAEVREHFGDRVFQTVIPRTVRLSEAPSFGKCILEYDPNGTGAKGYRSLAEEFLRRAESAPNQSERQDASEKV
jgi:chromosome partitioning protein